MSATPADDVQTSPAWNCGCKGTIIFGEMQENGKKIAMSSLEDDFACGKPVAKNDARVIGDSAEH
jgi:hypothetical protein